MVKITKVALVTGGPSLERGISLNSARSVLDHLEGDAVEIVPIYLDHNKRAYKISKAELYSNNPSDFDFKLSANSMLSSKQLIMLLKRCDMVFSTMHGPYGEDGGFHKILEKNKIPFVGSGSASCKKAFDKFTSNEELKKAGFYTLPSVLLKIYAKDNKKQIEQFFKKNKIKRAVVKPATGGSSIGVFSVESPKEALEKANIIFSKRMDTRVVIEPFAEGKEFTVIILQNKLGLPVAILPSEIEMTYHEGRIFDFRRKYLPTNQVKYHCPPRWGEEVVEKIRTQASQIFSLFKMNDFARFDGWVMDNGEIWFSDLNPISGMEQNSFLFQQASRIGMSHRDLLSYVLTNSCRRWGIDLAQTKIQNNLKNRKDVSVIFGGATSERQVSLMSGTNVWLKLRQSKIYNPTPYLLDKDGSVWKLPYALILNHTVEEIIQNAKEAPKHEKFIARLVQKVRGELMLEEKEATEKYFAPERMSFENFLSQSEFVFLGLHGGDGENGNFQKILELKKIKHNGSGSAVSRLCMDKFATGEFIRSADITGVGIAEQVVLPVSLLLKEKDLKTAWKNLVKKLGTDTLIVKPKDDGCSTGVARLCVAKDLDFYLAHLAKCASIIPHTLTNQSSVVEMPIKKPSEVLFERFIETDKVSIKKGKLKYNRKTGWLEVTIGLLEQKGVYHALYPSITVAEGEVLSLEEKFQGGTGVNLTPPPKEIIKEKAVLKAKKNIEELAKKIGLRGYARIDAFINSINGDLKVIEVNTLPGLTPSTVLYHQGLKENPPIFPRELLEKIINNAGY